MSYKSVITSLYYMLIYADGQANRKEVTIARQMMKAEGIEEPEFNALVNALKNKDKSALFAECMNGLRRLERVQQIRIIAWLCVVANADGFMEKSEWQLIYRIYHKELDLPLQEIFTVQKEINRTIWEQSSLAMQEE